MNKCSMISSSIEELVVMIRRRAANESLLLNCASDFACAGSAYSRNPAKNKYAVRYMSIWRWTPDSRKVDQRRVFYVTTRIEVGEE